MDISRCDSKRKGEARLGPRHGRRGPQKEAEMILYQELTWAGTSLQAGEAASGVKTHTGPELCSWGAQPICWRAICCVSVLKNRIEWGVQGYWGLRASHASGPGPGRSFLFRFRAGRNAGSNALTGESRRSQCVLCVAMPGRSMLSRAWVPSTTACSSSNMSESYSLWFAPRGEQHCALHVLHDLQHFQD